MDDWSESSGFKFHMMCEKKIKMNKNMHNQLSWPHIPLYTLVLCVHNRIAIIIGSLVSWAFVLCRLYPLSIILLFCWSRLQWIEMKVKWLSSPSRSLDCLFLSSHMMRSSKRDNAYRAIIFLDHTHPHTIKMHKWENRRHARLFFTVYVYIYISMKLFKHDMFYRYATKRWIARQNKIDEDQSTCQ